MRIGGRRFELDKAEGKLLGVCAGISNATGIDATIIRVGFVVATLLGGWPWTVIGYAVLAVVASAKRPERWSAERRLSEDEERARMRNIDLRMQAIETYVQSANSSLAREIEELR